MAAGIDELRGGLAAGEPVAFAALYDRIGPSLHRAAMGILGRRELAEDAVQEVFVSLVRYRHCLEAVEELRAYVFVLLRRAAKRANERRVRLVPLSEDVAETPADGPDLEECQRVQAAIGRLVFEQREVIVLKITGELTFEQIGQALEISPNTAASRYRYAIQKLRDLLGGES